MFRKLFKNIPSRFKIKNMKKIARKLKPKLSVPKIGVGLLILALLIQAGILGKNTYISTMAQSLDWGMSFQKDGEAPVCNSSKEYLSDFDAVYIGNESQKYVYLTFDAGYENGYTAAILDTLKKHDVKAAFFLVGHYIKTNPDLVKRMLDEGHIIANHTMAHPDMTKLGSSDFKKQLTDLEEIFEQTTGQQIAKFYRPPSGKYNEATLKSAQELGYTTVFWSSAYADWDNNKQPTHDAAFEKLMPRLHKGAIILLHATSKTNSEILDEYITRVKELGYTFKTLDQLGE